jgi:hypothetical protein
VGKGEVPLEALLSLPGAAACGSSGLPRTKNNRFPVLPVPDEQGSHRTLSSRGWAGRGRQMLVVLELRFRVVTNPGAPL